MKMLDEFVKQIKRVFSSKSNGGKLVYNLTNKLHYYKQILFATSIILLLGYSQFRDHFLCQGTDRADKTTVTNFCWINGTTTVNRIDGSQLLLSSSSSSDSKKPSKIPQELLSSGGKKKLGMPRDTTILEQIVPHAGSLFLTNKDKYELINHNYMRSLWTLLLLMVLCSYWASRKWSNIFSCDLLKALLNLPGKENLSIVKEAQDQKFYELLTQQQQQQPITTINSTAAAAVNSNFQLQQQQKKQQQFSFKDLFADQMFVDKFEILVGDQNEHNHQLDYYRNQLIYFLLPKQTSAYKLSNLKLRQQLFCYSIWSLLMSSMQFLLPRLFIGPHYTLYGWHFARLAVKHLSEQLLMMNNNNNTTTTTTNSIDYELSSAIFPTSTQCEFKQYGMNNHERSIVQCTVPINEICGKLFAIIWWFVALNILVELWCFVRILISSVNYQTIEWIFGRQYWPRAKEDAKLINRFRYQRSKLWARVEAEKSERLELEAPDLLPSSNIDHDNNNNLHHHHHQHRQFILSLDSSDNNIDRDLESQISVANNNNNNDRRQKPKRQVRELSERERKQLEATKGDTLSIGSLDSHKAKRSYFCINLCAFQGGKTGRFVRPFNRRASTNSGGGRNSKGISGSSGTYSENKHDIELYYLLYLLYLRLECSRKKVEQVIRTTAEGLSCHLALLEQKEYELSTASSSLLGSHMIGGGVAAGPMLSMGSTSTSTTIVPSTQAEISAAAASSFPGSEVTTMPTATNTTTAASSHNQQQQQQQQ